MNQTPTVPTPPSVSRNIREAVKEGLVNANDTVRVAIVARYIQDEEQRRIKAATKVLEKLEAAELELRKIKPSPSGFDLEGKPAGPLVFTKEQVDSAKKAKEQVAKLESALEKALLNNDFSKVFELGQ